MRFGIVLQCLVHTLLSVTTVLAFDFSFTAPTSCDNLNISWSGGSGPFSLLITPQFYVPQNISIPDSAFDPSSGNGSFSVQLTLPTTQKFLLTMSDSTGFETGGTSDVLIVGSSVSNASCNTTEPNADFFFELNTALQQCRTFTFSDYENATQPVRILGLIPLGQAFELDPPVGPTSFDWVANVPNGTSLVFIMVDADGKQGGSSSQLTVGASDDASCINASSPHSTAQATTTQSGIQATQTLEVTKSSNSKSGIIAGTVIGGLALLIFGLLLAFCLRRHKHTKNSRHSSLHRPSTAAIGSHSASNSRISRVRSTLIPNSRRSMRRAHPSFDLLPSNARTPMSESALPVNEEEYMPNPYILPSEAGAADGHSVRLPSGTYPREPPSTLQYSPPPGAMRYSHSHSHSHSHSQSQSHSRSRSRSDTDGPLSPISAFSNPYSQHVRHPSVPHSISSGAVGAISPKESTRSRSTPRFILHTDAEDTGSLPDEPDEVIELPPQYTDRHSSPRLAHPKEFDRVN